MRQAWRFGAAVALTVAATTANAATVRVEQGALSGGELPGLDTYFGIPMPPRLSARCAGSRLGRPPCGRARGRRSNSVRAACSSPSMPT